MTTQLVSVGQSCKLQNDIFYLVQLQTYIDNSTTTKQQLNHTRYNRIYSFIFVEKILFTDTISHTLSLT